MASDIEGWTPPCNCEECVWRREQEWRELVARLDEGSPPVQRPRHRGDPVNVQPRKIPGAAPGREDAAIRPEVRK